MKRLALVVALFLALPAGAQIYQWKDANGKTVMSDKPPVGQVRQQKTIESETQTQGGQKQKTLADRDLEFRKRQKESQESSEKARKEEASSAEKMENCANARRQLQVLESGERIALRDDKGERYFMDDAQREQDIAKARRFVDSSCN